MIGADCSSSVRLETFEEGEIKCQDNYVSKFVSGFRVVVSSITSDSEREVRIIIKPKRFLCMEKGKFYFGLKIDVMQYTRYINTVADSISKFSKLLYILKFVDFLTPHMLLKFYKMLMLHFDCIL